MEFSRLAIVGVGLIGASLGRAIRRARPGVEIRGYDPRPAPANVPTGVDRWVASPEAAFDEADLVVLAAPVGAILDLVPVAARLCPARALVTDTGSSKVEICRAARAAFLAPAGPHFIGGHPMAGSERRGAGAADPDLLAGAPYALCDEGSAPPAKRQAFEALLRDAGARPVGIDAAAHDRIVARISHLPQVVAVALASFLDEGAERDPRLAELAGGGLRDLLRVASSPYSVWKDILRSNAGEVRAGIEVLVGRLKEISARLEDESLAEWFERGKRFREQRLKGGE
jgi:prephenate dehydrogenase